MMTRYSRGYWYGRSTRAVILICVVFAFVLGWTAAWAEGLMSIEKRLTSLEQRLEQVKQRFDDIQKMLSNVHVVLPYAAAIRQCNGAIPAMDVARCVVASAQKWAGDNWRSVAWDIVVMGAVESNWDLDARGKAGECGPLQVMPATAVWMGAKNLTDWRQTLDAAVRYYATVCLPKARGDRELAVAMYNAGPSRGIHRIKQIASRHLAKVRSRAMLLANASSF